MTGTVEFVAIAGSVGRGVWLPETRLLSLGIEIAKSATLVGLRSLSSITHGRHYI
jgi:hypothetical protein